MFSRGTVSNYSVRAVIYPDEFVRSLSADYNRTVEGREQVVSFSATYESLDGDGVERPEWVEQEFE